MLVTNLGDQICWWYVWGGGLRTIFLDEKPFPQVLIFLYLAEIIPLFRLFASNSKTDESELQVFHLLHSFADLKHKIPLPIMNISFQDHIHVGVYIYKQNIRLKKYIYKDNFQKWISRWEVLYFMPFL